MIIEEQRGKKCPKEHPISVGNLSCEECDHFKFKTTDRAYSVDAQNQQILYSSDEWCELLLNVEAREKVDIPRGKVNDRGTKNEN